MPRRQARTTGRSKRSSRSSSRGKSNYKKRRSKKRKEDNPLRGGLIVLANFDKTNSKQPDYYGYLNVSSAALSHWLSHYEDFAEEYEGTERLSLKLALWDNDGECEKLVGGVELYLPDDYEAEEDEEEEEEDEDDDTPPSDRVK